MDSSKSILVLSSKRSIREHMDSDRLSDGFKKRYISIGDFFNEILIYPKPVIDDTLRYLYLNEACKSVKSFNKLKISSTFFAFLKEGRYILNFFDELANELVDISSIEINDTYSEYEEHLAILSEIKNIYKKILDREELSDRIFIEDEYSINYSFIGINSDITIELEGYLTNFEFKILSEVSKTCSVTINFITSDFNKKMIDKIGSNFESNLSISYHLSSNTIVSQSDYTPQNNIKIVSLSSRTLQVAYIKKRVYDYIKSGYSPNDIVVITPDESFVDMLSLFDVENNFNFAQGLSITKSYYYKAICAVANLCEEYNSKNRAEVIYYKSYDIYESLSSIYNSNIDREFFLNILNSSIKNEKDERFIIAIKEVIYRLNILLTYTIDFTYGEILNIFINRLKDSRIDDTRGGKITVMGVLEMRGISEFKVALIVDFNDDIVPNTNSDDMFINDQLKEHANLVTSKDRYNLQKYYYKRIFDLCSEVDIVFAKSGKKIPSRYLYDFGFSFSNYPLEDKLYRTMFNFIHTPYSKDNDEVRLEYDFTKIDLSATMLSSYLSCYRKFYYKYIDKIDDKHSFPVDYKDGKEIGVILHDVLYEIFSKGEVFSKANISSKLKYRFGSSSILDKYHRLLWEYKLDKFISNEANRYSFGYRAFKFEENISINHRGFVLVGTIDRIDTLGDKLHLLDYKSGSVNIKSNINSGGVQLPFYKLLASNLGDVTTASFYDLNSGEVKEDPYIDSKICEIDELLDTLKSSKEFNFSKTDRLNECLYCSYNKICKRD